jgi:hypothetical protein
MSAELNTTDVSGATQPSAGADSSAAALSVGTSEAPAPAETAGDVIAQSSAVEGTQQSDEDVLNDFLPADELEGSSDRYAKALLRVQNAHERLWEKHRAVQPLESFKPLAERNLSVETIQAAVEAQERFYSPVINPENNQPVYENGIPLYTTTPFIQHAEERNPGAATQLLEDAFLFETVNPQTGQKERLGNGLFRALGLDPARLDDYRNIDALAAQDTGQNLQEQLTKVREDLRDAFKSMPRGVRDDLMDIPDEETRNWHLEQQRERLVQKQQDEARQTQEAEQRKTYEASLRDNVAREQEADIETQFSEGLSSIMDDIASKVTFSSDAAQDAQQKAIISLALHSLRDPANHAHMKPYLDALGVSLDAAFGENLAAFSQSRRSYKALDLAGRKAQAESELAKAAGPRARVMTRAGQLALKMAEALGGQMKAKAESRNGQFQEAGQIRPTVNGQAPAGGTSIVDAARAAGIDLNDSRAVNTFILQYQQSQGQAAAGR